MLNINQLAVAYGQKQVLYSVSLKVKEGEIVALLGNNGAGKSTTLKAVCGLVQAKEGKIVFQGQEIQNKPTMNLVKFGISYVPEGRRVFGEMSVLENLRMGAYSRRHSKLDSDLEQIFSLFPRLKERTKQAAGSLSGGEQQMLAIGRALMSKPKLLILDEPSLGIAPIVVEQIGDTIQTLNKAGTTVILVEQNADLALSLANRAYILTGGRVVLEGQADELKGNDALVRAYLGGSSESQQRITL